MAKKKSGTSRSQSIRDHLTANSSDTPTQIVAALAKQGINVSPALAGNVKYTKRTTGKQKGAKRTVKRKLPGAQTVDLAALQAAITSCPRIENLYGELIFRHRGSRYAGTT